LALGLGVLPYLWILMQLMRILRAFPPMRYALALMLLFATAAPALARMTCMMSGTAW